jgi:hypothetical protein
MIDLFLSLAGGVNTMVDFCKNVSAVRRGGDKTAHYLVPFLVILLAYMICWEMFGNGHVRRMRRSIMVKNKNVSVRMMIAVLVCVVAALGSIQNISI